MLHKLTGTVITLMLIAVAAFSQPASKTVIYKKLIPGTTKQDTCHYVYIERDTNAKCYNRLSNLSGIRAAIKQLSKDYRYKVLPLRSVAAQFPEHWCSVPMLYKGEPFLYAPCDWYSHSITTLAANATIHGPESDPSLDTNLLVTGSSGRLLKMKYKNQASSPEAPLGLNIYIIDTVNNTAIFEETYKTAKARYRLMIDVRHIRSMPAIVYHCQCSKAIEYSCEKDGHYIDFPESVKQNELLIRRK